MPLDSRYLGLIDLEHALREQEVCARAGGDVVFGFECRPVITLGLRGRDVDAPSARFPVLNVDRGGQATLHNPGQLVIFPVCDVRRYGVRTWVHLLIEVTRRTAADSGHALEWREASPGLYDERGKVASIGLRIRRGISTHGVSINVRNHLPDFGQIRTCGHADAALSHLRTNDSLERLFARWCEHFAVAFS